jgi:hypothetical protein
MVQHFCSGSVDFKTKLLKLRFATDNFFGTFKRKNHQTSQKRNPSRYDTINRVTMTNVTYFILRKSFKTQV